MCPLSQQWNPVSIWDSTVKLILQGVGRFDKDFHYTQINITLLIVIHSTHHLQPGVRGDDLVLFVLAYHKAYKVIGDLIS